MSVRFPDTRGEISGWMMGSFVAGIAVHSAFLRHFLPVSTWTVLCVALAVMTAVLVYKSSFEENRYRWLFHHAAIVIACIFSFTIACVRVDAFPFPRLQRIDGRTFVVKQRSENATFFERWRFAMTQRIASALPHDEATLVSGILYGDQHFSKEQRDIFRRAGLMHIVAVSGSNVTIVIQFCAAVAARLGFRRRNAFIGMTVVLMLFTGFVGGSASVLRAALMGWLLLGAREVGRIAQPFRILLVTATILLFWNPWQLAYDMGFVLSFLAMWGILAWTPIFEARLSFIPDAFETRTTIAMTLGATLATAPYLAWAFQYLSLAGLVTNILALPLVSFLMMWGALTAIWANGPLAVVVNAPSFGLAYLIETIAGLVRYTPWLEYSFSRVPFSVVLATYIVLVYFSASLRKEIRLSTKKFS